MKNQPITAKIKKNTKGGMVTQPVLNMGAPVKMKAHSPAKATSSSPGDELTYDEKKAQYLKDQQILQKEPNPTERNRNLSLGARKDHLSEYGKAYTRTRNFERKLFNYDSKKDPSSTKGYSRKEYAEFKTKPKPKPKPKAKINKVTNTADAANTVDTANKTNTNTTVKTKKISYDKAYEATRNHKVYGKMSKAEYVKEAKRQNASKKAGKGWDVKNKAASTRKKVNTPDVKTVGTKKLTISTKLEPKAISLKAAKTIDGAKKVVGKTKSIDRKLAKADKARAEGNIKKALRKERAAEKKKKRISKRTGSSYSQGANAINPS